MLVEEGRSEELAEELGPEGSSEGETRFDYGAEDRPGTGRGESRQTSWSKSGFENHEKAGLPEVVGAEVDERIWRREN